MTERDLQEWEDQLRRQYSVVVALTGVVLLGIGTVAEAYLGWAGVGMLLGAALIRWV